MYAGANARPDGIKPGSLAVAIALNAAGLGAVLFAAPEIIRVPPPGTLTLRPIPIESPPPPEPVAQKAKTEPAPSPKPRPVDPIVKTSRPVEVGPIDALLPPAGSGEGAWGTGTDVVIDPPLPPPPRLIEPTLDQRFAGQFQPDYPAQERRLEREGSVVVRVLVGIDGRVQQVERLSATSDDFFAATQRAALARWRFRPATRGGVPIAQWKTMRVTFHLAEV